jgi:small neutral amino acid transporter SnatA (MarC family)
LGKSTGCPIEAGGGNTPGPGRPRAVAPAKIAQARPGLLPFTFQMDQTSITAAGVIDTFLVLLIGVGPKIALVPYLHITASLDEPTKRQVRHKMLITASTVAGALVIFGELLRALLHFSVGSLSIAGGLILLVLAMAMVLGQPGGDHRAEGKDPMQLAQVPLAVPYLLNPVGIVGLVTVSAEAKSFTVLAVEVGILGFVLLLDVVVFRWADAVSAKLDENRMLVTEKVFGFLIAAIAVQLVLDGLVSVGVISHLNH